jgi:hypothetical protein
VIEAVRVCNYAYVREAAEEDQRAELVLFVWARWLELRPELACAAALEVYAYGLKDAPHKTGTIEHARACSAINIGRAYPLVNCG